MSQRNGNSEEMRKAAEEKQLAILKSNAAMSRCLESFLAISDSRLKQNVRVCTRCFDDI